MHLNPDLLVLLALGESVDDPSVRHLETCAECQAELAALQRVVTTGRTVTSGDVLFTPNERVWHAIVAETTGRPPAPVIPLPVAAAATPARRRRRWAPVALAAALALVAGLGIGFGVNRALAPKANVVGVTTLNALPQWPGANGTATVEKDQNGNRTLVVTMTLPTSDKPQGQAVVWLSDTRALDMVDMGTMTDGTARLPIPASMDLKTHPIVDISLEPDPDPSPAHSETSMVRGRLAL